MYYWYLYITIQVNNFCSYILTPSFSPHGIYIIHLIKLRDVKWNYVSSKERRSWGIYRNNYTISKKYLKKKPITQVSQKNLFLPFPTFSSFSCNTLVILYIAIKIFLQWAFLFCHCSLISVTTEPPSSCYMNTSNHYDTWNLYSAVCPLYLNKTGKNKRRIALIKCV